MRRHRNIARLQAPQEQAKSAPDGPSRLRILENKLFAQRWDIKGLTRQRNEAYAEIERLKKELGKVRVGLEAAELDAKIARADREATERALEAQRAENWQASAVSNLAELCRSRRGWTYDLDTKPALLAEVMLIAISGLFNPAFYERQLRAPTDPLAALCHYIERGEGEGLKPCALFDPAWYVGQAVDTVPFRTKLAHYIATGTTQALSPHPFIDTDHLRRAAKCQSGQRFDALAFYLSDARYRDLAPHPMIDLAWYRTQRGEVLGDREAVADYLAEGVKQGFTLCPLFDSAFYKGFCDELRAGGEDPFRHYVTRGQRQGLAPNPLFEPAYYRTHWKGRNGPKPGAELTHYVTSGRRSGAATHPLFRGAHYRRVVGDDRVADPLAHYLTIGASQVRFPHPLFDLQYIRSIAPAALRYHANPLISFLRSPDRLVISPHPLFDAAHYVRQMPVAQDWSEGPFLHFLRFGAKNGADPHPLFDNRFYQAQLPREGAVDLALIHYLEHGSEAGLRAHPLFDPEFYMKTNPDLAEAKVDPLIHFVLFGGRKRDLRQPHLLFDIRYYADNYGAGLSDDMNLLVDFLANWRDRPCAHRLFDIRHYAAQEPACVDGRNPLADYASRGRSAGVAPHPLFDPVWYKKKMEVPPSWRRTLLEHYCNRLTPDEFFPHPEFDGARIVQQLGPDTTGLTLLERYLERKIRKQNSSRVASVR